MPQQPDKQNQNLSEIQNFGLGENTEPDLLNIYLNPEMQGRTAKRARHLLIATDSPHPLFFKSLSEEEITEVTESLHPISTDLSRNTKATEAQITKTLSAFKDLIPLSLQSWESLPGKPSAVFLSSIPEVRILLDTPLASQILYLISFSADFASQMPRNQESLEQRKAFLAVATGFAQVFFASHLELNNPPDIPHNQLNEEEKQKRRRKHVIWDKLTSHSLHKWAEKGHKDVTTAIVAEKALQFNNEVPSSPPEVEI